MPNRLSARRVIWLVLILVVLALYFPINHFAHGGVQLQLAIDEHIPLYPPAIVPYLLGSLLFIGFPIWAAINMKPGEFEAYAISVLLATVISYAVYWIFPTFVMRPEIPGKDIFSQAIGVLYQTDRAYNAAPSGHTFYTMLSFSYLGRWRPKYYLVWIISTVIILASTLLTRQHNILDLISGLALAIITYFMGIYIRKTRTVHFAS
jgi:membrane-associated phospholipid phosphatase